MYIIYIIDTCICILLFMDVYIYSSYREEILKLIITSILVPYDCVTGT